MSGQANSVSPKKNRPEGQDCDPKTIITKMWQDFRRNKDAHLEDQRRMAQQPFPIFLHQISAQTLALAQHMAQLPAIPQKEDFIRAKIRGYCLKSVDGYECCARANDDSIVEGFAYITTDFDQRKRLRDQIDGQKRPWRVDGIMVELEDGRRLLGLCVNLKLVMDCSPQMVEDL